MGWRRAGARSSHGRGTKGLGAYDCGDGGTGGDARDRIARRALREARTPGRRDSTGCVRRRHAICRRDVPATDPRRSGACSTISIHRRRSSGHAPTPRNRPRARSYEPLVMAKQTRCGSRGILSRRARRWLCFMTSRSMRLRWPRSCSQRPCKSSRWLNGGSWPGCLEPRRSRSVGRWTAPGSASRRSAAFWRRECPQPS